MLIIINISRSTSERIMSYLFSYSSMFLLKLLIIYLYYEYITCESYIDSINLDSKSYFIDNIQLSSLTHDEVNQWYDELQIHLINHAKLSQKSSTIDGSKHSILDDYINKYKGNKSHVLYPLTGFGSFHDGISCCLEDMSIQARGFTKVFKGFENSNLKPILLLFMQLSTSKRSYVNIGDSMSIQTFMSILYEFDREISRNNEEKYGKLIKLHENNQKFSQELLLKLKSYEKEFEQIKRRNSQSISLTERLLLDHEVYIWYPPSYPHSNKPILQYKGISVIKPVYLYSFRINNFDKFNESLEENALNVHAYQEMIISHVIISHLNEIDHPDGLFIIGNIGIWIKTSICEKMNSYLTWFHGLHESNPKTILVFRETTLGYDPLRKRSISFVDIDSTTNAYDHFSCKAYPYDINTIEEMSSKICAKSILQVWNHQSNIYYYDINQYFNHFITMKVGSCNFLNDRKIDCIHFCGFSPVQWLPIFYDFNRILYDVDYNDLKLYKHYYHQILDDNLSYSSLSNKIVRDSESNDLYLIRNGVKNLIIDGNIHNVNAYSSQHYKREDIMNISSKVLNEIITGFSIHYNEVSP